MRAIVVALLGLYFALPLLGQDGKEGEVYRTTVSFTPSENGYAVQIPIAYKFINCFGDVVLTITKKNDEVTFGDYIYNGQRYTPADVGLSAFEGTRPGLTNVTADLYDQSFRLGPVTLNNLIDYLGGCFGQIYDVLKELGLDHKTYRDKLHDLRLSNIRITDCSTRDYELEGKIQEVAKQRELTSKTQEADQALARGDLEEAERLYKEAQKLDYSHEHIRQQLDKIKQLKQEAANEEAYEEQMEKGTAALERAKYEEAKAAYQKALQYKPDDAAARQRLEEIEEKLAKEAQAAKDEEQRKQQQQQAQRQAASQRHSGRMWGNNFGSDAYGSGVQESNLIGLFRVDYDIWTAAGEPGHKFRFYWEWADALNTGYPQYVSVLKDTVVMIAELQAYPDLWDRWNAIKPLYVEIESDILYYKSDDTYVANKGRIKIIPEIIGRSGESVDWSLPGSSNWDELFPYCNYLDHGYFREIGVQEEMEKQADRYGNDITWPKYAFQYSNDINFFQDHRWLDSKYLELSDEDYNNYSSSVDIVKIVWPVKQIQDLIRDYEKRLKEEKEDKMDKEDFWSTPENEEEADGGEDFWDTPNNDLTVREKEEQKLDYQTQQLLDNWPKIIQQRQAKYAMLNNPFTLAYPTANSTVQEGELTVMGKIHSFLTNGVVDLSLRVNQEAFRLSTSGGNFTSEVYLEEGWNNIVLDIDAGKYGFVDSARVYYEKPPPLPCDEQTSSGGSGQTINEHGLGTTAGVFYVKYDMYSAPDEMIIYAGPKEKRYKARILFDTDGYVSGSRRIQIPFSDIDTGIITVEVNGSSGTSWNYLIECP